MELINKHNINTYTPKYKCSGPYFDNTNGDNIIILSLKIRNMKTAHINLKNTLTYHFLKITIKFNQQM